MGFEVRAVVELRKVPHEHQMDNFDHVFGAVEHAPGSKTVTLIEHVGVSDEADAVAFVRDLVTDAVPDGTKITSVVATPD
jgi:hypothetical protein